MEKIEILLEKLDNRITPSLAKRLDSYENLNDELDELGKEYEENPSDENRAKYNEIIENFEKIELGIIVDLESLLEKRKEEALAKEQKANEPEPAPNPSVNPTTEIKVEKEEKKEGSGVLTLIIGGVFLVASFGAINFLRKR
jgi:hypothetical protein